VTQLYRDKGTKQAIFTTGDAGTETRIFALKGGKDGKGWTSLRLGKVEIKANHPSHHVLGPKGRLQSILEKGSSVGALPTGGVQVSGNAGCLCGRTRAGREVFSRGRHGQDRVREGGTVSPQKPVG